MTVELAAIEQLLAVDGAPAERCRLGVEALSEAVADFVSGSGETPTPPTAAVKAELERYAKASEACEAARAALSDEAVRRLRSTTPEHHLSLFSPEQDEVHRTRAFFVSMAARDYATKEGRRSDPHAFRLLCRAATIWRACRLTWPPQTRATDASRPGNNQPAGAVDSRLLTELRVAVEHIDAALSKRLKDGTYCTAVADRRAAFPLLERDRLLSEPEAASLITSNMGDPWRRAPDVLVLANSSGAIRLVSQELRFK